MNVYIIIIINSIIYSCPMVEAIHMSITEQIHKQMWYIHEMEYNSAIKMMQYWETLHYGWTLKIWWSVKEASHQTAHVIWSQRETWHQQHKLHDLYMWIVWSQCWGYVCSSFPWVRLFFYKSERKIQGRSWIFPSTTWLTWPWCLMWGLGKNLFCYKDLDHVSLHQFLFNCSACSPKPL